MKRPVEVVRLPRRHVTAPPSAPLPEPVQTALSSIAGDLRHLPRDCIGDAAELFVWLRRMAGRVEGVGRMRVPDVRVNASVKRTRMPVSTTYEPVGKIDMAEARTPRDLAEAVFGSRATMARQEPRTITSRRGRPVRVEVRRARAAGQMELGL